VRVPEDVLGLVLRHLRNHRSSWPDDVVAPDIRALRADAEQWAAYTAPVLVTDLFALVRRAGAGEPSRASLALLSVLSHALGSAALSASWTQA
jgi:hypothetical protein